MRLSAVTLQAPAGRIGELTDFYCAELGLGDVSGGWAPKETATRRSGAVLGVGWSELRFAAAAEGAAPFYHFALLVPGDRFGAALDWIGARAALLAIGDSAEVVMRFENWRADSCYFHDPVGNIVELIAHEAVGANRVRGPFEAEELLGLSEIGLVGEPGRVASVLTAELSLEVFQGAVSWLAFVGAPTAALILAGDDYAWLPQGRRAVAWPVEATVSAGPRAEGGSRTVAAGIHRVTVT